MGWLCRGKAGVAPVVISVDSAYQFRSNFIKQYNTLVSVT